MDLTNVSRLFLYAFGVLGLFGVFIGIFLFFFLVTLTDKKPADHILMGICLFDLLACLLDALQGVL